MTTRVAILSDIIHIRGDIEDFREVASPPFWKLLKTLLIRGLEASIVKTIVTIVRRVDKQAIALQKSTLDAQVRINKISKELRKEQFASENALEFALLFEDLGKNFEDSIKSTEKVLSRLQELRSQTQVLAEEAKTSAFRTLEELLDKIENTFGLTYNILNDSNDSILNILENLSLIPELHRRIKADQHTSSEGRPWREVWADLKS